jgi:hypothetical protein
MKKAAGAGVVGNKNVIPCNGEGGRKYHNQGQLILQLLKNTQYQRCNATIEMEHNYCC